MNGAVSRLMRVINIGLARLRLHMACQLARLTRAEHLLRMPCSMMELRLQNPVGVAAGMDRIGRLAGRVSAIGFGFLEIGSVTPKNLNSTLANFQRRATRQESGIVGVNVACLRQAKGDGAIQQYVGVSRSCLPFANYLVLNLSSPLTSRTCAAGRQSLETLLSEVATARDLFQIETGRRVPLTVKVSMTQTGEQDALERLQMARALGFEDAITVTPRDMPDTRIHDALRTAKRIIGDMTLLSVGGVVSAAQVRDRFRCGAEAVQLFTRIVEHGPLIAWQIVSELTPAFTTLAPSHERAP